MAVNLHDALNSNETILWEGKPNKRCFILESIFNPLLPFALIWLIVDTSFISEVIGTGMDFFIIPFFLLHLMPVWLYAGGIILAVRRYQNTQYIITDHAIYISRGAFTYSYQVRSFAQLSDISMHRGILDQWLNVGDVIFGNIYTYSDDNRHTNDFIISDIEDYQKVYQLVLNLQKDIYADTQYPNDLRPTENHGYKTKYHENDLFK